MTDRELLESAAKAAGMALADYQSGGDDALNGLWMARGYANPVTGSRDWNPLKDDGDALRLAVKLMISVGTGPCKATASEIRLTLRGIFLEEDTIDQCEFLAVRRVIVRAAAEIAKAMP